MAKYIRKTCDRWDVMTNYGYGWECEYSAYNRTEARQIAKDYRENTNASVKIEQHREKLNQGEIQND